MTTMLLQQALGELKLIDRRLATARQDATGFLARPAAQRDPLEKQGGSEAFVKERFQAARDLAKRRVAIRTAITRTNLATPLTVDAGPGEQITRSVAEWLTYRRDVLPGEKAFVAQVRSYLANARGSVAKTAPQARFVPATKGAETELTDVIVNVDEKDLSVQAERLDAIEQNLDTQLSILNATVMVDIED